MSYKKMKTGLKKFWANETNREIHRNRMLEVYSNPEKVQHIKDGCKAYWAKEDNRRAQRERMLAYWKEHPEKLEQMKQTNSRVQKALWTPEKRKQQSETLKQLWRDNGFAMAKKRAETMKRNGTVNTSSSAQYCLQLLDSLSFTVQTEQPYPFKELSRFPYDAYIVELDTYIEFNFGFFHGKEPYVGSYEQLQHIKWLKQKDKEYFETTENPSKRSKYADKIQKWTINDVVKRSFFQQHPEYTWFEFFTVQEFELWLSILTEQNK